MNSNYWFFYINLDQVQTQTNGLPFLMNYYLKQKIKKRQIGKKYKIQETGFVQSLHVSFML